jgi:hypothetical protein
MGANWENPGLRLELWIRLQPERLRELRLFSSTAGLWTDENLMRSAELANDSTWASVDAVTSGRPRRATFPRNTRWHTYLAVPVSVTLPGGCVQVGAVVLASKLPAKPSGMSDDNAATVHKIVKILRDTGTCLLTVAAPADQ